MQKTIKNILTTIYSTLPYSLRTYMANPYIYISVGVMLFFTLCAFLRFGKKVETIKIGVLHSLTGAMATSEAPLVDAIRFAVEEINESGVLNDRKVEMIVADCRSDANFCAKQAEILIAKDRVNALFGCWTSTCRRAVKAVVEKHDHLLFYPAQYEGLEKSDNIFYTGAAPNQQIIPMVSWALKHKGKRFYLVGSDYIFPHIANLIIKDILLIKGGQLVGQRYFTLGANNLSASINEILLFRPDFVINTLNGDSNIHFFRALDKAGIHADKIPVFSTSIAETELTFLQTKNKNLAAGHYAAWNYFQSIDTPENKNFVMRFKARFGKDRVLSDPMEASYLGVKLWAAVIAEQDSTDLNLLRTNLALQTMPAPQGIVSIDFDTRHLWKKIYIGQARNDGQFDIVWQSPKTLHPAPFPFYHTQEEWQILREQISREHP